MIRSTRKKKENPFMLINFMGCPKSGKTTTAARLFAHLKENGNCSEFVVEQARVYIAQQRLRRMVPADKKFILTDQEQVEIMKRQLELEETMKAAAGGMGLVISDSSVFNTLLYMSPKTIESTEVQNMIRDAQKNVDLIFVASRFNEGTKAELFSDPNRIHNSDEIDLIDQMVPIIVKKHTGSISKVILRGSQEERFSRAVVDTCRKMIGTI